MPTAPSLSFSLCQCSCKEIDFSEQTGAYSASNLGGWGLPNWLTSDATAATLTVVEPGGTSTVINLFATTDFPSSNPGIEYTINSSILGLGTNQNLPDGIYKFTYSVSTPGPSPTPVVTEEVFFCQSEQCIENMFGDIFTEKCKDCQDAKIEDALQAWAFLQALNAAASRNETQSAEDLIDLLNNLCSDNGTCKNC